MHAYALELLQEKVSHHFAIAAAVVPCARIPSYLLVTKEQVRLYAHEVAASWNSNRPSLALACWTWGVAPGTSRQLSVSIPLKSSGFYRLSNSFILTLTLLVGHV